MELEVATLVYNTPDLAEEMRRQIPSISVIDNGSDPPIANSKFRLNKNEYFVGGWNAYVLTKTNAKYLWMCDSDVTGISLPRAEELMFILSTTGGFAVTPSFNSGHPSIRNGSNIGCKIHIHSPTRGDVQIRQLPWLDWTCTMVNVETFKKLGGFDPLFLGYGADIDISKRAFDLRYKMFVADYLSVHHLCSQTVVRTGNEEQNDLSDMNKKLRTKWKVNSWPKMFKR